MKPPLLAMTGITKSFPGVRALADVELALGRGEVLALVGENGAGKSTLMKILGGAHRPDAGLIRIEGEPVSITDPPHARRAGIAVIHQEFQLVPSLSAAANVFLGREESRLGWVARKREKERARAIFERLGVPIDPDVPCRELTMAQQQVVEIAKALSANVRILVMDEPTAALTPAEVDRLAALIGDLRAQGIGIIFTSHRLDEVFRVADRVMVLRDGQRIADRPIGEVTRPQLIEWMVGRELRDEFPRREVERGEPRLVVRDLRRGRRVRGVSFEVRRGEVLGLTGLVGSGRTETARLVFGADRPDAGQIMLDGRRLDIRRPRDAIRAGIGLLPEDRQSQGLVLAHGVRENFALPNMDRLARCGFIREGLVTHQLARYARDLRIRLTRSHAPVRNLSGGNQQKVVLAKWLARQCEVLLFDEPTRGIDVGAKFEIHRLINELAAHGKAVLLISSELPEVLGMADRILVMHEGRITGEITDPSAATQEEIMQLAIG